MAESKSIVELLPRHITAISKIARETPELFIREVLGTILYEKSREIIKAVWENDQVAVASCHGSGKSFLSARLAATQLIAYPGQIKVVTTAPTQRQVESIFWAEYRTAIAQSKIPYGGKLNLSSHTLSDSWFAQGFTARKNDTVSFQGYHAPRVFIVIDEASGVDSSVWSAINTLKSGGHVKILAIGNPTSTDGDFFDCFKRFANSWYKIHISAFDTPNVQAVGKGYTGPDLIPGLITYKYVKQMYREYGEDSPFYQVRVLGEFPHETDFTLIQVLWVDFAVNDPPAFDYNDDVYAGFDAARSGLDESALAIRCGTRLVKPVIAWTGMDEMQSVAVIRRHLDPLRGKLKAIRVDTVGIGAGIHDRLKEIGYPVVAINGSETARNDPVQFRNLRAEMWWTLRNVFKSRMIGGSLDELTQHQLTSIRYQYTSGNQLQIEDKNDYKKRMGYSPDRAEAILYCYADVGDRAITPVALPGFGEYGIIEQAQRIAQKTGLSVVNTPLDYDGRLIAGHSSRGATMAQRRALRQSRQLRQAYRRGFPRPGGGY